MKILNLGCSNFRNLNIPFLEITDGINVFFGRNGHGKSNFAELFNMIFFCRPIRGSRDAELLCRKDSPARLKCSFSLLDEIESQGVDEAMKFVSDNINRGVELSISPDKGKVLRVNREKVARLSDFVGTLRGVVFTPEDIELILGGPEKRRRYMDVCLSMVKKEYLSALKDYKKSLKAKRAAILKGEHPGVIRALNIMMAKSGAFITYCRQELVSRLSRDTRIVYSKISGDCRDLSIRYCSTVDLNEFKGESGVVLLNDLVKSFENKLKSIFNRELESKRILAGPHRDDILIDLGPGAARSYASRGEAKSLALALKLVEAGMLTGVSAGPPVIVLDDALSELDEIRRRNVMELLPECAQAIITVPDRRLVPCLVDREFAFFSVENGLIKLEP